MQNYSRSPEPNPVERAVSMVPNPSVAVSAQESERSAASSTPDDHENRDTEMAHLSEFLRKYSQGEVLRHFLGHPLPGVPALLNEALVIALDTEWWQDNPKAVTEMGFAELQWWRSDCNIVANTSSGYRAHAAERLQGIHASHVRIMEYAHLVNSYLGAGDPELFFFGHTEFIPGRMASMMLSDMFLRLRYTRSPSGGKYRPVIFIGHDISNDFERLNEAFGVDLLAHGNIVKVIDTQTLAQEAGIESPRGPQISLTDLLTHFHIIPRNLHTAGNDVAYTMIAAVLVSLCSHLYPSGTQAFAVDPYSCSSTHRPRCCKRHVL